MTFKEFKILYHVKTIAPREHSEEEISEDDDDIVDEYKTYDRVIIPNLDQIWLRLKPS
jgi:hypothetical protein